MQRIVALLLTLSLALSACSKADPLKQVALLPVASLAATATAALFQSTVDTPTPTPVFEQDFSLIATPTVTLTATLTPTLTSSPMLTATGLPARPALLSTQAPEKSRFLKQEKGGEPCG